MIKHIYCFKLKDRTQAPVIAQRLLTLKKHVPSILDMEVGVDFKGAENSFDLIEICTFKNMEAFLEFGVDTYHDSIRKYMVEVQEIGIKLDYEY